MIIERTKDEIIFRLPGNIDIDDLQDLADFLTFKEISTKSMASQEDVDILANTVKKGRWAKTKAKIGL